MRSRRHRAIITAGAVLVVLIAAVSLYQTVAVSADAQVRASLPFTVFNRRHTPPLSSLQRYQSRLSRIDIMSINQQLKRHRTSQRK